MDDILDAEIIQWCIDKHKLTNHFYDIYLPYEFHLRMTAQVCVDFYEKVRLDCSFNSVYYGCWGHDLIEDARCSYNDVKKILGQPVADIIYAVTNEKGKTRKERASTMYYVGIKNTEGATFVKLCDRIANVQYSKLTKSSMFETYKKENKYFVEMLYDERYIVMFDYLDSLFVN